MKKRLFIKACLTGLAALFFATAIASGGVRTAPGGVKHVIIISFDGGGGLPETWKQRTNMPTFLRMAKEGACTWSARTIFPPTTLPSHTSMLTGLAPEKPGVLWNSYDTEMKPLGVPTIFGLAKSRGLKTAMFVGKSKFLHLNVPGTLDLYVLPEPKAGAKEVAAAFVSAFDGLKPSLCFVHFADPDSAGHSSGWGSPEQSEALAECDHALKTICDALNDAGVMDSTVIILTADHGGHGKSHGADIPEDMTIPWVASGRGVRKGVELTGPVTTYDTAATALWLLGLPLPATLDGRPVTEAFE
ncbi:MAG: ectonucleotide pyrophosphatase/phosphodiesterase [Verrucomicrobiota bacterium]